MKNLFSFLRKKDHISKLIKACVFHYELEFIHPFSDGNGRMGRLWQQLILMQYHPVFEFLSVESFIKENQWDYYRILSKCDSLGESTLFIEFNLSLIKQALEAYCKSVEYKPSTQKDRIEYAKEQFSVNWFSRQDYLNFHKTISMATASRDLFFGVRAGILQSLGERNQTRYRYKT